ncbi:MAG: Ig-like domain-containing protein, partial [Planctomycetota bacterium]
MRQYFPMVSVACGAATWLCAQSPKPCDPAADAPAANVAATATTTLHIYPPSVQLDDGKDRQRLTMLELTPSGATIDRTDAVSWTIVEPDLAELARDGEAFVLRGRRSRRLDPSAPEQSLLLQKATGAVPHKGNKRFAVDSPPYRSLREWIDKGAPDDKATASALLGIDILPDSAVLVGTGQQVPLQVRARYQNGTDRDVTALALWSSSNDSTASVANDGRTTSHDAGEACVLTRFGGFATAAQVLVLASDQPFVWPDVPTFNFIDRHVHQKLQRARVAPADA